jgi:hypothetical protein
MWCGTLDTNQDTSEDCFTFKLVPHRVQVSFFATVLSTTLTTHRWWIVLDSNQP